MAAELLPSPGSGAPTPRAADRAAHLDAGALVAGRYRLAELIGRGATARVWRARDEHRHREVAVKQFRGRYPHGVREADIAARVRHPHVAAVHEVVKYRDSVCLVMDYHGGPTLAAVLGIAGSLPPRTVAGLGRQLLAALRAVHAADVVHCDVKPGNLLLDDEGRLTLVDFGIAEAAGATPHPARRDGYVTGSPAYMAPELVRGEAPQPGTDLWSFGATLYAAVEGRRPFPQVDAVPTLAAVLHDAPTPARRARRLRPLLDRLLVKDPVRRPTHATVDALLEEAYPGEPAFRVRALRNGSDRQQAEPAA